MGGGTVTSTKATGYTNSATVYPTLWVKCSSGTFAMVAADGSGDWDIACATVGGAWTLITDASDAAVTQNTAWQTAADGDLQIEFSGADAEVWMPTLTEVDGLSVIPTGAAAVDTGDIAFEVDNSSGDYWVSGATESSVLDEIAGTCIVTGSTIYLGGSTGSECTGALSSYEVTR